MELFKFEPTPNDHCYGKAKKKGYTKLCVFGPGDFIYSLLCGYIIELIEHKHVRFSGQMLITQ